MKRPSIDNEDEDEDDVAVERPRWRARVGDWLLRHPRDAVGLLAAASAVLAITVNALWLQTGAHPAPLFALRPVTTHSVPRSAASEALVPRPRPTKANYVVETGPARPRTRTEVVAAIQTELTKRGFYAGAVDGVYGPKTDAAVRDFAEAAKFKPDAEPSETLLQTIERSNARVVRAAPPTPASRKPSDPIANLIGRSGRVVAVQRALSDFGYGQIDPTGIAGPDTVAAIEKFERSRQLPVTGQVSESLMRELAVVTGRPLE